MGLRTRAVGKYSMGIRWHKNVTLEKQFHYDLKVFSINFCPLECSIDSTRIYEIFVMNKHFNSIQWGSDDDALQFGLLCFWILSIVQYFLKHNFSETGSISVFRCGTRGIYSVGSNRVGALCPKLEGGKRSNFRNFVF